MFHFSTSFSSPQVLIITLDQEAAPMTLLDTDEGALPDNLFLNYLSRIHREEDFDFILKGVTRLLMNPLVQTYLPHSQRKVAFHQELLIFFWKFCEHNKKFLFFVLNGTFITFLILAMAFVFLTALRALFGQYSPRQNDGVPAAAMFWHTVGAMYWITWIAVYVTK